MADPQVRPLQLLSMKVAALSEGFLPHPPCSSPEFFNLMKQAMREEMFKFCQQENLASARLDIDSFHEFENPARGSDGYRPRIPWPPKAARKQHFVQTDTKYVGLEDDPDRDDTVESEFLSDEEVEDIKVSERSAFLFKSEDYQYLLSKSLAALDLIETPLDADTPNPGVHTRLKGMEKFFPLTLLG